MRLGGWSGVLLVLCAVALGSGALAAADLLGGGLALTGKNRPVYWSAFIASLVFFSGIAHGAGWLAAWAAWRQSRLLPVAAALAVSAGVAGIVNPLLHLGRPGQMSYMMTAPDLRSPLFWDMVSVNAFVGAAVTVAALTMMAGRWPRLAPLLRPAASVLALLALGAELVSLWIFRMPRVPGWSSPLALPQALSAALAGGAALMVLGLAAGGGSGRDEGDRNGDGVRAWRRPLAGALALTLVLITAGLVLEWLGAGVGDAAAALHDRLTGRYAVWFWSAMVAGYLLPLALLLRREAGTAALVAAALLSLGGAWLERWVTVVAGLSNPRLRVWSGHTALTAHELRIVLAEAALLVVAFALCRGLGPKVGARA